LTALSVGLVSVQHFLVFFAWEKEKKKFFVTCSKKILLRKLGG
jgi:hypothetical protein